MAKHDYDCGFFDELSEEDKQEMDAIWELQNGLARKVDFDEVLERALERSDRLHENEAKSRQELYSELQDSYTLYLSAHDNYPKQKSIEDACKARKIPITRASHLSIQIVKLILRRPDKTSYQYALALRGASLMRIPHDALAEELAKKGHGIVEKARFFSKERPKRRPAADSRDSSVQSTGRVAGDYDAVAELPQPGASAGQIAVLQASEKEPIEACPGGAGAGSSRGDGSHSTSGDGLVNKGLKEEEDDAAPKHRTPPAKGAFRLSV